MPASIGMFDIVRFGSAVAAFALLTACTSTEATLDPNALRSQQAAPQGATSELPANGEAHAASLQLAGIVGAPTQAVTFLTERMIQQGPARNLTIVLAGGSAAYAIKGLVSTSPEGAQTIIDFTWELTDNTGAAVHRATGKRTATGNGTGWQAVTQADMEMIADETIAGISAWLSTRS